ncbi:hypothetical protein ACFV7R_42380 [Streptomyces sp. NPDC059866]|uniref:hypothetical protein n=1 Tax=Streptomyces sp. NPDC059866 TaxID=3346978 RepID=UPI00365691E4
MSSIAEGGNGVGAGARGTPGVSTVLPAAHPLGWTLWPDGAQNGGAGAAGRPLPPAGIARSNGVRWTY